MFDLFPIILRREGVSAAKDWNGGYCAIEGKKTLTQLIVLAIQVGVVPIWWKDSTATRKEVAILTI